MSKELKRIVREIQYAKDLTIEQVAYSIGYSRVHLTREMKKEGKSELEKLLKEKYPKVIQSVSSGNGNHTPQTDLQAILRGHAETGIRHEAALNILMVTMAEFVAGKSGKSIAYEHSELQKAISSESDRLLNERRKTG